MAAFSYAHAIMTYYVKVYPNIIALSFYISFSVCMLTESLHELLHELHIITHFEPRP